MAEERVQRRLAAILAADVVGYSRLVEADEAGTVARLKALQTDLILPMIAKDGGRVVKVMGDGVLVEFGSAVDAVRNALAIQTEMARHNADLAEADRIVFRVGVNLGDVIIEADDIHGDGVNVAARLEGLCAPGEVYVSASVFDQVTGKLEATFDDLGEQALKNISRPVRVYRAQVGSVTDPVPQTSPEALPLPDKPSVAVLPFDNLSGDPEQEYFSDGITEDIITSLSRIRWFFVTARNSSFSYKGTKSDVRQIANDLGVRYVLEGSVRKAGARVRITAQLIDGATGNHVWAERYDRELADVFDLQDEMTERIVGAIEPAITKTEIQRSKMKRPDNLDAWNLCQRGWWHRYRIRREDYVEARGFFERALEADSEFVSALAGLSDVLSYEVLFSFADDPVAQAERAVRIARRAVEIDDEDPVVYVSLGRAYLVAEQIESAIGAFRKALQLNPYFAAAHYALGHVYIVVGRLQDGIDAVRRAIALSPQDLMMGPFYSRIAQAFLAMKDYEKAKENAEEAFRCPTPPNWPGKSYLVSALGHLGDQAAASRALEELLQFKSDLTIDWIRSRVRPANMGREYVHDYIDGLRKAGLPE